MSKFFINRYSRKLKLTKKSLTYTIFKNSDMQEGTLDTKFNSRIAMSEEQLEELRKEDRVRYYQKRTNEIIDIVNCNDFKTFLTISFEDIKGDTEEEREEFVKYEFKKIRQRLEKYTNRKMKYICRIERGEKNDRLHLHLLTDIDYISNHSRIWNDTKKINKNYDSNIIYDVVKNTSNRNLDLKEKRKKFFNNGDSLLKVVLGVGHCDIQKINSHLKVVNYITKYITKDLESLESFKNKRLIWTSRGLEKSVKVTNEDVLEYIEIEKYIKSFDDDKKNYYENDDIIKIDIYDIDMQDFYYTMKDLELYEDIEKSKSTIRKKLKISENENIMKKIKIFKKYEYEIKMYKYAKQGILI